MGLRFNSIAYEHGCANDFGSNHTKSKCIHPECVDHGSQSLLVVARELVEDDAAGRGAFYFEQIRFAFPEKAFF